MSSNEEKQDDFGLVHWEDVQSYSDKKFDNETRADWSDILKLTEGNNIVRVVTKPHVYWLHKYKADPEAAGYPDKIKCSSHYGECPICDLKTDEDKPFCPRKKQHYLGVIDRKTQSFKVIDVGPLLMQKLLEVKDDETWGPLSDYDINIKVNKNGGATGYYAVVPRSKTPLSKADIEIRNQIDYEALKAKCMPYRPEWVAKKMLQQKPAATGQSAPAEKPKPAKARPRVAAPPVLKESLSENDEYDFPAANVDDD